MLGNMVKRGLLMRVKDGLYYVIPFEQDPETFMPDWHLLSQYLVGDAEYYVGYFSALQMYQPPIVWSRTRFEFRSRQLIRGLCFFRSRATKMMFEGKERLSAHQVPTIQLRRGRKGLWFCVCGGRQGLCGRRGDLWRQQER